MLTTNDIRRRFIEYFQQHNHTLLPSGALVPTSDPTLLFTSAGMVPFKRVLAGTAKPPAPRVVTVQKCLRAGGKHNDLENVGYTARHHTFFEMLGNFSFGDYFKADAIKMAWEFLTKELALSPDQLLVTVYHTDDEAHKLWQSVAGLDERRIIRISNSDNFWQMGDTGPCGPCSEIFFDHGPQIAGHPPGSGKDEGARFVEIWNLVFMQYNRHPDGKDEPLPRPAIDTGMGLERITAVLQGRHDNYDTDAIRAIIEASAALTGSDMDGRSRAAHKVIADHVRACAFLISEGLLPANEGRNYVLRRILRRAIRHAYHLGIREPLLYRLVPVLVQQYGEYYNDLARSAGLIADVIRAEESRFLGLLERGLAILARSLDSLTQGGQIPGDVAFTLYDTFGFPLDLTASIATERGYTVDENGFHQRMKEQRERARKNWKGSGDSQEAQAYAQLSNDVPATDFSGYLHHREEAIVQALVVENALCPAVKKKDASVVVVCNQTPFYPESGGQSADIGDITSALGGRVAVHDTQKIAPGIIVHHGTLKEGTLSVGDEVTLTIDREHRCLTTAAHSATHLLLAGLRDILGDHVIQRGAFKGAGTLRFDFSHHQSVEREQWRELEDHINQAVRDNFPVVTRIMALDEARALGAQAQFGEKYGQEVRVVAMGRDVDHAASNLRHAHSLELCGGTHVGQTGEIGYVRLLRESSVSSGVRRIEAVVADQAVRSADDHAILVQQIGSLLKAAPSEIAQRVADLQRQRNELQKQWETLNSQQSVANALQAMRAADPFHHAGSICVRMLRSDGLQPANFRALADGLRHDSSTVNVVFGVADAPKVAMMVVVADDLCAQGVDAVQLVRGSVSEIGGKGGGGRPHMAQAGGCVADDQNMTTALDNAVSALIKGLPQP